MAFLTGRFPLDMAADYLAGHDQGLEARGRNQRRIETNGKRHANAPNDLP